MAINPSKPCQVEGGTQDNGTWANNNPDCDQNTWPQNIYGDGGNAGFDATNSDYRFNEFTSGATDANFEGGDPTKWVIIAAPLANSGEAVALLLAADRRPEPADRGTPDLLGPPARVALVGFRSGRKPDRSAAGHHARHRELRGELPGVHRVLQHSPAAVTSSRSAARRARTRPVT